MHKIRMIYLSNISYSSYKINQNSEIKIKRNAAFKKI